MSKLKKVRDYLEQKLNEIIEDTEDKRPPKEWWNSCYETIKKKNPNYTDEQIRGTCGKIYHKMGVREKIGDFVDDLDDILPSKTVKEPGSFREYCGGEVTDECIERGLNSDNKSIQAKAKLAKAFKTMRAQKKAKKKKDFQVVNDFVTTDFQVINDSTLGGYIVRDGDYEYHAPDGSITIKYKDWDNIQEAYGAINHAIAFGSRNPDSHTERDDKMIGYFDDFKFIPKGTKGPTKPYVDEKYNRVWARINTNKHITELSDLQLDDLRNLPVSASYDDYGYGDKQIIGKIHHIAVSLNKNERDRCSTAGGTPCNVSLSQDHDHNLKEATTIADNDIKQGVLRADFSQPPTNKTKKMSTMENEKNKDQPKQEKDMSSTEEIEEEAEEEVYDKEKKKDTAFDMEAITQMVEDKIKASIKVEPQVDMSEFKAIVDYLKSEKEAIETKKVQDLKEILIKPPYNYKEDSIKEMSLQELEHAKKLREMQSDFQPISGGATEINKEIFMKLSDFTPNMGYDPWAKVRQDFEGKRIVLKDEVLLVR
ncbi:MAG: hypothetical protein ACFFG0_05660 [Candidatus Thorarchaeota archaeon]